LKVLITGASGQVGRALLKSVPSGVSNLRLVLKEISNA
jgi:dTDP-4-dehydrorhamnose reductase